MKVKVFKFEDDGLQLLVESSSSNGFDAEMLGKATDEEMIEDFLKDKDSVLEMAKKWAIHNGNYASSQIKDAYSGLNYADIVKFKRLTDEEIK